MESTRISHDPRKEQVQKYFKDLDEETPFIPSLDPVKLTDFYKNQPFNYDVGLLICRIINDLSDHEDEKSINGFTRIKAFRCTKYEKHREKDICPFYGVENFLRKEPQRNFNITSFGVLHTNPLKQMIPNIQFVFGGVRDMVFFEQLKGLVNRTVRVRKIIPGNDKDIIANIIAQIIGTLNVIFNTWITMETGGSHLSNLFVENLDHEIVIKYPGVNPGESFYVRTNFVVMFPLKVFEYDRDPEEEQNDYNLFKTRRQEDIQGCVEFLKDLYSSTNHSFKLSTGNKNVLGDYLPYEYVLKSPPQGVPVWGCKGNCIPKEDLTLKLDLNTVILTDFIDIYDYMDILSKEIILRSNVNACMENYDKFKRETPFRHETLRDFYNEMLKVIVKRFPELDKDGVISNIIISSRFSAPYPLPYPSFL